MQEGIFNEGGGSRYSVETKVSIVHSEHYISILAVNPGSMTYYAIEDMLSILV